MARDTRTIGSTQEPARVYAPSNGSLAYRTDYAYRTAQLAAQPKRRPEPALEPHIGTKPKQRRVSLIEIARRNKFFPKLLAVMCVFAVAAVAVFTVVRFVNIAGIQANINELNAQIEATQRSIDNLDSSTQPIMNVTEVANSVGLVPALP